MNPVGLKKARSSLLLGPTSIKAKHISKQAHTLYTTCIHTYMDGHADLLDRNHLAFIQIINDNKSFILVPPLDG